MKTTLKIFGFLIFVIFLFGFYKISTFQLFDNTIIELKNLKIPNKNYTIKIYQIPGNATLQQSIQVRKVKDNNEIVLFNIDRFDKLDYFKIADDSLILKISNQQKLINPKVIKYKLP